jgi:hypothetical protein
MKTLWLLIVLVSGTSLCALQGTTPEAALEEIATTTKPEVLARHLPEPVQKSIEELPLVKKQAIMDQLLALKESKLDNCTVRPAHDTDGWEIIGEDGVVKGKVRLDSAFISGLDAMLPIRIESGSETQTFIVGMHLEDKEWRIRDVGSWEKTDLGLDDLLHEPTEIEKNETAARETLRNIFRAALQFGSTHSDIGFPSTLKQMTEPIQLVPEQPAQRFLDESYAADPLIKDGYRFRYINTGWPNGEADGLGTFELIAIPVEFGKTGTTSYFLNQHGSLHATTGNRPATEEDPTYSEKGVENGAQIIVLD